MSKRHGVTTSESRTPYWMTEIDGKVLLVKAEERPAGEVTGEIRRVPSDVRSLLLGAPPGTFHTSYVDTGSYRIGGWIGLVFAAGVLAGAGILGYRASQRLADQRTHPTSRRIAGWGDPAAVAGQLAEELEHPLVKKGGVKLTQTYVVSAGVFGYAVYRWEDLLWAHMKVVKHSMNFIPTGTTYHAVLRFADGEVTLRGTEATVQGMLNSAELRAPWAVLGHSDEVERIYAKDRAGFVAMVAERREELRRQALKG